MKKMALEKMLVATVMAVATSVLLIHPVEAQVYKTVDEHGNVTYTDKPAPNDKREQVELPPINQLPVQHITQKVVPPEGFAGYEAVFISQPANDAVIGNEQETIGVELALEPGLQEGHLVQFYFNGSPSGQPMPSNSHRIGNLERGSYSISAVVMDEQGQVLASAAPVVVHVQRHFVPKAVPQAK